MNLTALATMAVGAPLRTLTQAFAEQSGDHVHVQVDTSPNITRRLAAGEIADILIAQTTTVDQLIAESRAFGDSRTRIGKIGVGVAIQPRRRTPGYLHSRGAEGSAAAGRCGCL